MIGDEDPEDGGLSTGAAVLRLTIFALGLAGLATIAIGAGPDVQDIRRWIGDLGWVAPPAFVLLYAALTVALVPGSVLTLAAGLLFGAGLAPVLVVIGATTGAVVAFAIARTAGRPAVERLVSGRAAQVDRWLRDRGLTAVITLRLVPLVPFSAANYAAGITGIRARHFVIGTAIGIIPGAIAYSVLGARVADPTDPLFLGAMVALALLTVVGSVILRRSNPEPASASAGGPPDQEAERRPATSAGSSREDEPVP